MKTVRHLAYVALMFIVMIVITFIFSGCNVSKHITKTSSDSTSVIHLDSSKSTIQITSKKVDSSSTNTKRLDIIFGDGSEDDYGLNDSVDTIVNTPGVKPPKTNDVKIKFTDSGAEVINNSGKQIKNIIYTDTKKKDHNSDTSSYVSSKSKSNYSDSNNVKKKLTNIAKVSKPGTGLFSWTGIAVFSCVIVYVIGRIFVFFYPETTGILALLFKRRKNNNT